jgi:hypothetical protein
MAKVHRNGDSPGTTSSLRKLLAILRVERGKENEAKILELVLCPVTITSQAGQEAGTFVIGNGVLIAACEYYRKDRMNDCAGLPVYLPALMAPRDLTAAGTN